MRTAGARVGVPEGTIEACWLGAKDGFSFGALDGLYEEVKVGMSVGTLVVGVEVGCNVGLRVGMVGCSLVDISDGSAVGSAVGSEVGDSVLGDADVSSAVGKAGDTLGAEVTGMLGGNWVVGAKTGPSVAGAIETVGTEAIGITSDINKKKRNTIFHQHLS